MFVQNLISDFNNQLSISDHDLNVLSGFFHFLKNQTNTSRASVPYGLLLQYDNEKVKELFLKILDKALMAPQFSGKYRLVWINEEDFSRKSLGQCVNRSGDIFLLRTCLSHGNPDHLISEFATHGFNILRRSKQHQSLAESRIGAFRTHKLRVDARLQM